MRANDGPARSATPDALHLSLLTRFPQSASLRRNVDVVKDVRMIEIDVILLVGAVVLIAAIIAARIGARVGLPSLLLFLGLGLVMGDSGIGIPFDNADLAQALGFAALVVILAEGGLTTKWSDIRSSTILATLLATVGVGSAWA